MRDARPAVALDGRFLQRATYAERGIGRVARELARRLAAAAQDLRFVLLGAVGVPFDLRGPVPPGLEVRTYRRPVLAAHAPKVKLELLFEELAFQRAVRACGAAAILTPSPHAAFPLAGPPRVLLLLDVIPYLFAKEEMPTAALRAFFALTAEGTRRARRIVAISAASARDAVRALSLRPSRIRIAPLAADPRFRLLGPEAIAAVRRQLGLPERFILCVGGFDRRKNVPALLEIFGRIAPRAPGVDLVLAGRVEPHQRADLARAIAALGPATAPRVRALEFVPDDDLPALLGAATVLAFPSRYEGFGLPLLEALACGTPSVAFDNSSIPEVAGDAALLVRDGDDAAFGAALLRVLEDERLRSDLARRGPARAARFDWDRTAAVVAAALRDACGVPPRPP